MGIGLFGKYPLKRDFIASNLPRTVLDPYERWLQSGIAASREARGRGWNEMFLVQPIWNFRLGRQITGVDCLGAMMPSVDGVGRYFPLSIIAYAPSPAEGFPIWTRLDAGAWLAEVHGRLLSALAEGELPTPEELVKGLDMPMMATVSERRAGQPLAFQMDGGIEPVHAGLQEADLELAASMQSIWWTDGGSFVPPQVVACQGMPNPDLFTRMMGDASERAVSAGDPAQSVG